MSKSYIIGRRFVSNLTAFPPEAFLWLLGLIGLHFGSLALFPDTSAYQAVEVGTGRHVLVFPVFSSISPFWGVLLFGVGAVSVAASVSSLFTADRLVRVNYLVSVANLFLWAFISLALYQRGVPLNVLKLFIGLFVVTLFACLLLWERQRRKTATDDTATLAAKRENERLSQVRERAKELLSK